MKRLVIGLVLVLLVLVPVACASAPQPTSFPDSMPAPMPPGGRGETVAPGGLPSTEERMIVRTGNMSLIVKDVIGARDEIGQLAVRFNGYVVSSQISGEDQDLTGYISIRVPDDGFDQVLTELRKLAVRVPSEGTSSQDVTEEYVDLQSRLKNAEATERQYLALLEEAKSVDETLKIYESLSRIRSEIEQIKGRMQYLERTSSMSLIEVRLRPEASAKPLAGTGWNVIEILKSAIRGLATAGQVIVAIAIWLIIFIPIWGTILGIILWRRRRKKAKAI